ncbi:MAG: cell division protein FtsZ [Paludibacteraceae bacterium]|nr:cell division protein FtsZ [Paludibacteraceae bacterium]
MNNDFVPTNETSSTPVENSASAQTSKFISFDEPSTLSSIIKVVGVGGGGSNSVNHMFDEKVEKVDFIICNTDRQALEASPIPDENKILLGPICCKGLGAGARPEVAEEAARESLETIKDYLSKNTSMVFITAGMGGGTGTGAAPIIAQLAKEMGILTVGIVTIPFLFEGKAKIRQALEGISKLEKNVDALLVINNERLRDIYPDLEITEAFNKADDVVANAARGIAEIITKTGKLNVDFQDITTIMKNSGVAVMNTGYSTGENRMRRAIDDAINSPLLKDNDIHGAKRILLVFYCRSDSGQIKMDEITEINDFMAENGIAEKVIWGLYYDEELEENQVKITLIATGFKVMDLDLGKEWRRVGVEPGNLFSGQSSPTIGIAKPETQSLNAGTASGFQTEVKNNVFADGINETKHSEDRFNEFYGDTKQVQQETRHAIEQKLEQTDNENILKELEDQPAIDRRGNIAPKPYKPSNHRKD